MQYVSKVSFVFLALIIVGCSDKNEDSAPKQNAASSPRKVPVTEASNAGSDNATRRSSDDVFSTEQPTVNNGDDQQPRIRAKTSLDFPGLATIHIEPADDCVRLIWVIRGWEQGQTGFVLKRRSGSGGWEQMNDAPIQIGIWPDKALDNIESDEGVRAALETAKIQSIKEAGPMTTKQLLALFPDAAAPPIKWAPLRGMYSGSFDMACILGFGMADRNATADDDFEYGLFAAKANGQADENPLCTQTIPDPDSSLLAQDPIASPASKGVLIDWGLNDDIVWKRGVFGFHVYKKAADELKYLSEVGSAMVTGKRREFVYVDEDAEQEKDAAYVLKPMSVFGTTLEGHDSVIEYESKPVETKTTAGVRPVIDSVEGGRIEGLTVKWNHPPDAKVRGFFVQRVFSDDYGENRTQYSKLLPSDSREFLDPLTDVSDKEGYVSIMYVVAVVTDDGAFNSRGKRALVLIDNRPGAPTDLAAEIVTINSKPHIQLTWKPPTTGNSKALGYALWSDYHGAPPFSMDGRVPMVVETNYNYAVDTTLPALRKMGVSALNDQGKTGPPAVVEIQTPGEYLQPVKKLTKTGRGTQKLPYTIEWEYAPREDLAGFKVLDGEEVIATEDDLNADARSYELAPFESDELHQMSVVAVSLFGPESKPSDISLHRIERVRASSAVQNLAAQWLDKEDSQALIHWKAPRLNAEVVDGYAIFVDKTTFGKLERIEDLHKDTSFVWTPPDPDRSYYVQVIGINLDGVPGLPAETYLLKPGAKLPPATFSNIRSRVTADGRVELAWEYRNIKNHAGFRLYHNGKLVANEKQLVAGSRGIVSKSLPAGEHKFEIEAITADGEASERGTPIVRQVNEKK